jgi:hypothetical protein
MPTMDLTPDVAQWDPYNENFVEAKDRFLALFGDLINRPEKRRTILDDVDVFELQVFEVRYEAAINSIVAAIHNHVTGNKVEDACANSQDGDFNFIRDDTYMQAGIAYITA